MDNEDSKDCVIVENTNEPTTSLEEMIIPETRPIMLLFYRLLSNNYKQKTLLTTEEIRSILLEEFNMDMNKYHPLEVKIYVSIVKRYLKDWPEWAEFDGIISRLRKLNETSLIKNILKHKYKNLKEYLWLMLEATKPLAEQKIKDLANDELDTIDIRDIVLEIHSSRKQLNELIFNKPNPEHNNTIFNLPSNDQNITVKKFPIESILNYPNVKVTIDLKLIEYHRYTQHELKHVLVNRELNTPDEKLTLNTVIQHKSTAISSLQWNKRKIKSLLDNISRAVPKSDRKKIECVLNVIKSDFDAMATEIIKAPGFYRQYSNKHPYFRKLFIPVETKECATDNTTYDLYIKETISPMHVFHIGKISQTSHKTVPPKFSWLKIECLLCEITFTNENFNEELVEHFKEQHIDEPDWTCSNCNKSFTMIDLSFKKWQHICGVTDKE